ncbi:MAG: TIGR00730 family Rossman fold protein [Flammeovirgaceae bacterium]|nr:TIGR00730 family Rossman fold protein [Flammeovirgaceae bacterium]
MNLCVFCGSSSGLNGIYEKTARDLSKLIGENNHTLVYGGGNIGLMGILADGVLQHKGKVVGVIPEFLVQKEVAHHGLSTLEVVSSMHERKQRMADISDAFIALPGGWGTLDELAEILTWHQLGLVKKPIGLLNINSYFNFLIQQMDLMVKEGFLPKETRQNLTVSETPVNLLTMLGVDFVK